MSREEYSIGLFFLHQVGKIFLPHNISDHLYLLLGLVVAVVQFHIKIFYIDLNILSPCLRLR